MLLKSCHHHGFTVSSIDASLRFYRDMLGLELIRVSERKDLPSYNHILGYDNVKLNVALLSHPVNGFLLELFEYMNPPSTKRELANYYVGSSHIAFEVEDIDAVYKKLLSAGYSSINDPVDVIRGGHRVARCIYALDPDGISVELFQEYADVVVE